MIGRAPGETVKVKGGRGEKGGNASLPGDKPQVSRVNPFSASEATALAIHYTRGVTLPRGTPAHQPEGGAQVRKVMSEASLPKTPSRKGW
eukprot:scaffold16275_cov118-Isochrysis_galbana.AAC.4